MDSKLTGMTIIRYANIQRYANTFVFGLVATLIQTSFSMNAAAITIEEQRSNYIEAEKALHQGKLDQYKTLKKTLVNYPLYPHLELQELQNRLPELPIVEVHQFQNTYKNSLVEKQLLDDWLKTIAKQEKWKLYVQEFPTSGVQSSELQCHFHWAQYQSGLVNSALAATPNLWTVGQSQPKSCDPLFDVWRKNKGLTTDLAWKRFSLTMKKNNRTLARYLKRFLPKQKRMMADVYLNVHRAPKNMKQYPILKQKGELNKDIVLHALNRLARQDSKSAIEYKAYYSKFHFFSPEESKQLDKTLARSASFSYKEYAQALLDVADPEYKDKELSEWRLRVALKDLDWSRVYHLYGKIAPELQLKQKWRYWRARAVEQLQKSKSKESTIFSIDYQSEYQDIAKERGFYSFLAAELINDKHYLQHKSLDVSQQTILQVENHPGIRSALEFFAIKQYNNARREWRYASRNFTQPEHKAAASIARAWGWDNQSINSMIAGGLWDDMDLRFPTAFQEDIIKTAKSNNIDSSWVFAIARQESAFMFDARSPAGAIGLLQLMPGTAKQVARQNGISFRRKRDLINPQKNIKLGSAYLKQMLKRFDGNRVYATAAYNAGPNRVSRWLKERNGLPEDIWAETIPFSETRQYVQNVLTYAVIYGSHIGEYQSVLYRTLETHPMQITRAKTSIKFNNL